MSLKPAVTIRILGANDAAVLSNVAEDVFDHPLQDRWITEFLNDPRHHMAVALLEGQVIGFASGVHYVHPDKPPELFINEVGVASDHQRQGIGRQLMDALLARGRELGCAGAWVLTERDNTAARGLYRASGGMEGTDEVVLIGFNLETD
jgi:ribosomal protein S18 acetylase RimI-like enzyme